jgi:hypothetical protein
MRKKELPGNSGVMMMQENSFFSRPMTYFGTYENIEEESDDEDEGWNFTEDWRMILDPNTPFLLEQRIGLFIHWHDVTE